MYQRAENTLQVHTTVIKEAFVFNRDSRVLHVLRNVVDVDFFTVLPVEASDLRPVGGEHLGLLSQRPLFQLSRERLEDFGNVLSTDRGDTNRRNRQTGTHNSRDCTDRNELQDQRHSVGFFVGRRRHHAIIVPTTANTWAQLKLSIRSGFACHKLHESHLGWACKSHRREDRKAQSCTDVNRDS